MIFNYTAPYTAPVVCPNRHTPADVIMLSPEEVRNLYTSNASFPFSPPKEGPSNASFPFSPPKEGPSNASFPFSPHKEGPGCRCRTLISTLASTNERNRKIGMIISIALTLLTIAAATCCIWQGAQTIALEGGAASIGNYFLLYIGTTYALASIGNMVYYWHLRRSAKNTNLSPLYQRRDAIRQIGLSLLAPITFCVAAAAGMTD